MKNYTTVSIERFKNAQNEVIATKINKDDIVGVMKTAMALAAVTLGRDLTEEEETFGIKLSAAMQYLMFDADNYAIDLINRAYMGIAIESEDNIKA